ncbi:MAG: hypothetical protein MUE44_06230 [Oscillatoriaceae cyanobacterium Prado104]|nr:hypothetical protein [Oscillatoriaceae cyanobacterium Prado104]
MRFLEIPPGNLIPDPVTIHNLRSASYDLIISIFSDPTVKLKTLKVLYCRMLLAACDLARAADGRIKLLLLLGTKGDRTSVRFNFW